MRWNPLCRCAEDGACPRVSNADCESSFISYLCADPSQSAAVIPGDVYIIKDTPVVVAGAKLTIPPVGFCATVLSFAQVAASAVSSCGGLSHLWASSPSAPSKNGAVVEQNGATSLIVESSSLPNVFATSALIVLCVQDKSCSIPAAALVSRSRFGLKLAAEWDPSRIFLRGRPSAGWQVLRVCRCGSSGVKLWSLSCGG